MDTGISFIFLIFCATLCQEILTSSEERNEKSWDLLSRQKRIINKAPGGDVPDVLMYVPYVVSVHKNGVLHCGGSILTATVILTAAQCVFKQAIYTVLSGSAHINLGVRHNVTGKQIHQSYNFHLKQNDIALLHISPAIDLIHSRNRKIELYEGRVYSNAYGTVSGWGCHEEVGMQREYPMQLRSIIVRVFSLDKCRFLRGYSPAIVTEENVCTFDKHTQKYCSVGDIGNPLAVDGKLLGVLTWSGTRIHAENPDIFIKVAQPSIRNWIISHTRIIEGWS